ncbi:MAG: hypothetical protein OQJ89_00410 [Kangiellaceae bacterium]|nr:hypothetical protein [Kangiellaceae bacterium]MCW8998370.1 hypothetical protein [Kangiellaceae bacterium]MCW9015401.1 hypothetical protein [Kangiellaceae bacterium]
MKTKLVIGIILLLLHYPIKADVMVGVWNIENLSPTIKRGFPERQGSEQFGPRTNGQLDKIADHIKNDLKVSAIMLTEIHGDQELATHNKSSQLDYIEERLGDKWDYWIGQSGGKQRIAFLYNKDEVRLLDIWEIQVPKIKVQGSDIYHRDPLVAHVKFREGGNDVFIVGLHLKSVQTNVHNHMAAVAKLLGVLSDAKGRKNHGLPRLSVENEVIVMGDLNDSSHNKNGFKFLFDYFEGVGYTHLGDAEDYPDTRVNGSEIDHVFVSKKLKAEVVNDSFKVHVIGETEVERDRYRKTYSDHYPITVKLRTHADND